MSVANGVVATSPSHASYRARRHHSSGRLSIVGAPPDPTRHARSVSSIGFRAPTYPASKEEIAEQIELPDSLGREFYNRNYYGHIKANAKAVYVKYLGHFSGNPAELDPLPPVPAAQRYLRYMGGEDETLAKARVSFDEGDYRWVAEVVNHVVMANPANGAARELLADAYEQLGYQCESAPWRNFYLCGALELRAGTAPGGVVQVSEGMARGMPLANLFQALAVRLNPKRAAGVSLNLNLDFADLGERWQLVIDNTVLHYHADRSAADPSATLRISSVNFKLLMLGLADGAALLDSGDLAVDGDAGALLQLRGLFDQFVRRFPIVEPRPALED